MEDRTLETRESFDLIRRMIANTRHRMESNAGRPFLVWGYTTLLVTAAVWIALAETGNPRWNLLWLALPLIGGGVMFATRTKRAEGFAYTFVDTVINQIWFVLGITVALVSLLPLTAAVHLPILFLITLLMGIGTMLTGLVIRFTATTIGGAIGIVLSITMLWLENGWALGAFMGAFVAMMIVPGHILNYHSNHTDRNV